MLTIQGLEKSYPTPQGPLPVLRGVDLDLEAGQTLAVMGESGSGKSTLLHLIAGLDSPDAGAVLFEDSDVGLLTEAERAALRRTRMGLVFQQFHLIPSLSVEDNLRFQARLSGREEPRWTAQLIERLGLGPTLERYPEQLSGGQQQRLAIGRTLAARPALILADEPTGALDAANGDAVLDLALALVAEAGAALLMATHSQRLAARLGARIDLINGALAPAGAGR